MPRSLQSTFVIGAFILAIALAAGPLVSAEEGGGGGGEGGGSESQSTPSSGGGPGRGGHSGHGTNVIFAISRWMAAQYQIGELPPGAFGGGETPLSENELQYICSMHRALRTSSDAMLAVLAMQMSVIMSRPPEFIANALRNPFLCTPQTAVN